MRHHHFSNYKNLEYICCRTIVYTVKHEERMDTNLESINVLVTFPSPWIDEKCQQEIANVSPRIKVRAVTELLTPEQRESYTTKEQFDALLAKDFYAKENFDTLLADTEVIFGHILPKNVTTRAPKLRWIQANSAGVEKLLVDGAVIKSPVLMTHIRGIHDVPISEFTLGLMLTFAKEFPLYRDLQKKKQWQPSYEATTLRSKTVGIVGMGSIGREIARLSKAFGMRVVATRWSVKQATQEENADMVLPSAQLPQLLRESDFVVIAAPFTPKTRNMIGGKELQMMKPTAYIINIARGGIVNEKALIRALEDNWIAGAGLDAFDTEPLPPESRLWELPNILITPHISWWRADYFIQATLQFCDNLRRYLKGEQLLNLVDKEAGY
jgi:phosphoglycerate dehydrogenase-like enzyme